jgi:hypothetical protein
MKPAARFSSGAARSLRLALAAERARLPGERDIADSLRL